MKDKLFSNIGLKLLAVVFAFIVWVIVLNLDDYVVSKQISGIPVQMLNEDAITSQGQLYYVKSGDTVNIIVKGRRSVIAELNADDFKASADLSQLSITNSVPIKVEAVNKNIASSVSVSMTDSVVTVELEKEETSSVPVTVKVEGEAESGYTAGEPVTTPNLVNITGAVSVVDSIATAQVVVDVSGSTREVNTTGKLVFYDKDGQAVADSKITCDNDTIAVKIPIYKTKAVLVRVSTTGTPGEGYLIGSIEYGPETVVVGAPNDELEALDEIVISDVDISGATENYETNIDITPYLPDNVVLADKSNNMINVRVLIEHNITRSISLNAGDITILNKNEDKNYEISFPDGNVVEIVGLGDDISKVKGSDLKIKIDADSLSMGENTVELTVSDGEKYTVKSVCKVLITVTDIP